MATLTSDLATIISRDLRSFEQELELFADDASIWQTMPGVTNSAGNLALHLSGNLQHFVGATIGQTGYVRNRPVEFGTNSGTRADVIAELQKAGAVVRAVLPTITDAQLEGRFPGQMGPVELPMRIALVQLAAHVAFHLGQAGYLRRMLTGDTRSTDPMSTVTLAGMLQEE